MEERDGPPRFDGGKKQSDDTSNPPRFSETPPASASAPPDPPSVEAVVSPTTAPADSQSTEPVRPPPPSPATSVPQTHSVSASPHDGSVVAQAPPTSSRKVRRETKKQEKKERKERTAAFRRARRVAWLFGSIALLSAGAAGGWWYGELRNQDVPVTSVTAVVDRPVIVQQTNTRGSGRVPDVVGLSSEQARQVFVDAGFLPEQIESVEQGSARPEGEVLGQDPAPGAGVAGVITIWTSISAAMPDLTGLGIDEARTELQSLGARISVERRYVVGVVPEQVVESEPRSGQSLTPEARLVVSSPGASVFLNQLNASDFSGCTFSDETIGAISVDDAILCDPDRDEVPFVEYLVGRETATIEGVFGRPLSSDLGVSMTIRILADGRQVFTDQVIGGQPIEFEADVSNSSRVRIEVERIDAREDRGNVFLAFGEVRFTGSNDSIAIIREENS